MKFRKAKIKPKKWNPIHDLRKCHGCPVRWDCKKMNDDYICRKCAKHELNEFNQSDCKHDCLNYIGYHNSIYNGRSSCPFIKIKNK